MPDLGARLQLFVGPTVPIPAPYPVIDALQEVEVTNKDQDADAFQIKFSIGKELPFDYGLLLSGLLDPPSRVIVMVIIGVLPQVLIDGVITNHQVVPSNRPGESTLVVTGDDVTTMLNLEEKSETHPNQPDSLIVTKLLAGYALYGLVPTVTPTTDVPIELDRVPTQQGTDLAYIRELARRNGFVFYVEPTAVPFVNTAYWGSENRLGMPQPALRLSMGGDTNVDQPINFRYDALAPASPQVSVVEPLTRLRIPIPVPSGLRPPLASRPAAPLRRTIPRDTAGLNPIQAGLRGVSEASRSADAVTGTGELDAVRYGRALRSRRLVCVSGAGLTHDGLYYVQEVTHRIKRGEYKQSFTLKREGRGALTPVCPP